MLRVEPLAELYKMPRVALQCPSRYVAVHQQLALVVLHDRRQDAVEPPRSIWQVEPPQGDHVKAVAPLTKRGIAWPTVLALPLRSQHLKQLATCAQE